MQAAAIYQSNYRNMVSLKGPKNDAIEITNLLNACGIETKIFSSKPPDLEKYDIVFMSGHGTTMDNEGTFICPQPDFRGKFRPHDYIHGHELKNDSFVILDACYSGKFKDSECHKSVIKGIQLKNESAPNKTISDIHEGFFASTAVTLAQDICISDHWHGAFTFAFLVVCRMGIPSNISMSRFLEMMKAVLISSHTNQLISIKQVNKNSYGEEVYQYLIDKLSTYKRKDL